LRTLALNVRMLPPVEDYLLAITRATREDEEIALGASPRGALALARVGRALALLAGRSYVRPDDIQRAAGPVLAHRLILAPEARLRGHRPSDTVARIVAATPVPVEDAAE
jgi:MoxR-like ATPase